MFPLFASRETVSGTRATRRSPGVVSLGTPIFISRRDELLEARADLGREAFDGLDVEWLRERDDESLDADPRVGADLLRDLVGGPDERLLRRALAVVLLDALEVAPAFRRVVADDAPAARPGLDLVGIAPDVDAVLAQDRDLAVRSVRFSPPPPIKIGSRFWIGRTRTSAFVSS